MPESNIISLLEPGNLLIWLPGLLFLAALVYSSRALKKGTASRATQLAPPGLFIIAIAMAFLVPMQEMGKAIRFANTHESHAETPVGRYTDIGYAAKDAWLRTGLPEEERGGGFATSGDLFNFEEPAASGEAAQGYSDAVDDTAGNDTVELVYQPEKNIAWAILMLSLIAGGLYFLQDFKGFVQTRR